MKFLISWSEYGQNFALFISVNGVEIHKAY